MAELSAIQPDPTTGLIHVDDLPDGVRQMLAAFLNGTIGGPGGTVPADLQAQLDGKASVTALQSTFDTIKWNGGTWPQRPANPRPIIWRGGPSSPPRTGSTAGGGGMAPDDVWLAAGSAVT